jgi:hypothetical protein
MTAPEIDSFQNPIDAQDRELFAEIQRMLVELIDRAVIGSVVRKPRRTEPYCSTDARLLPVERAAVDVLAEAGGIAALLGR